MFEARDTPRVFALPVGADFSRDFARGLLSLTAGHPPEHLAKILIVVNSARMRQAILAHLSETGARLLPRIHVVTDLPDLPILPHALPPQTPPLRRQLLLAQAVGALLRAEDAFAPQAAKYDLAGSLAALMDEMQAEGIHPQALERIEVGQHADHWRHALTFLRIIAGHWDAARATDPQDRLRGAADMLADHWQAVPPDHPVIVAGSTGSRGATATLMAAVAGLPQGAVVLPGWDAAQPAHVWHGMADAAVPSNHPQSALRAFCARVGVDPAALPIWGDAVPANPARAALLSLALRPAPFTDQWLEEGPGLVAALSEACDALDLQLAMSPKEEALAIALRLRDAAERGETAVFISPDRVLARRVEATLDRWGITPDDSAGRPLHQTPPGIFFRLVAQLIGRSVTPERFIALMKHPFVAAEGRDGGDRLILRAFERDFRKHATPHFDLSSLQAWARGGDTPDPARVRWADWVVAALEPLQALTDGDAANFLAAHRRASEALVRGGGAGSADRLWTQDDGEALAKLFAEIEAEADHAGVETAQDYRALFDTLLSTRDVRQSRPAHPGIAVWGTLEARVAQADLVILGGLNDPVWPGTEAPDPWLNRAMRRQVGLPPPERATGLSAHDFQQAAAAPRVVLSRALRDGEAPTVGSRWIVRLLNLLGGLGLEGDAAVSDMTARGASWLALARQLDRPAAPVAPARRPAPIPPADARLEALSITEVERLIRDPYAIYAKRILGLRKLDPLGLEADERIRGNALHKVVEVFCERYPGALPQDAARVFVDTAREVLAGQVPWPATRVFWLGRLARIADWFVETEARRRDGAQVAAREVWGERHLQTPPLRLYGKADRIDRRADGTLAIYDYKTGNLPTEKQVEYFQKQLLVEAAIAAEGGFEGLEPATTSRTAYIKLSEKGALSGLGEEKETPLTPEEIDRVWLDFSALVASYAAPDQGFPSRVRVRDLAYGYDYDHLARKGEWWETDDPDPEAVP